MSAIAFIVYILVAVLPLLFLKKIWKFYQLCHIINKIPGPKSHFLLGNVLELSGNPRAATVQYDLERFKKYGPVSREWLINTPLIHFYSAESCEILLGGMKNLEKSLIYDLLSHWLGQGLLTSKGPKWQKHRKMITPTFHFKILENFLDIIVEKSQILVEVLEEQSKKGEIFNVLPYVTNAALDIICETAMATNIEAQQTSQNEYMTAIYSLSKMVVHRASSPWLMSDLIYNITPAGKKWFKALQSLHGFTERVIAERKAARLAKALKVPSTKDQDYDLGKKKRVAFLDLLLDVADKDPSLTDKDIREEVDTFMFEGHDTTTVGISWAIYLLGRHADIQQKVYQELDEIFNGEERPITFQDVSEMKYLERVIKETLRLFPPVPGYGRKLDESIEVHGYTIPAGAHVTVNAYSLHRNPEYFPDPERFNPDNFLPENIKDRHPFAYLPFSAGPRNCIGQKFALMEEKTVLASILRRFKIISTDKLEDIVQVAELILRPYTGINIQLVKRT